MIFTMKHRILAGALGFLLGAGLPVATASIYDIDDVYRMARQAKDAAKEAKAAAEEVKKTIGNPYAYGTVAWHLRKAAECD